MGNTLRKSILASKHFQQQGMYIYIYIYINIFYLHVYFYPLLVDIVPTCPESSLQYYDYDPRAAYF